MSTFLNEKVEPLLKEDLSYEIIDGKFVQVYKPCICIYKVIIFFLIYLIFLLIILLFYFYIFIFF